VGKKAVRDVVVEMHFAPFDDEEPSTIFDANSGSWRD
jgi:hypothetical protein